MEKDPVAARLSASRLELLDLTLRNPLLNHRPSPARGLEIVDEDPKALFGTFVVEGKPLRFHATREEPPPAGRVPVAEGFEAMEVTGIESGLGAANPASSLATPYTREDLDDRLQSTHYHAESSLSEQGANILFLALGMLRWRDPGSPREDRLAPLVLLPARLSRKSARAQWQLLAAEEDPGLNLSLLEKLRDLDFVVKPPAELETPEDLAAAFEAFKPVVEGREGWAVEPSRIVLGFFSFGKFLMYRDLDPAVWPEGRRPERHPLLASLLAEGFRDRGAALAPGRSLDELRAPGRVVEILDADGSQAEALADVAAGRSLVIQGPPGTGKSQTISNLIAEAASAGKRVLFVAEKMAALEVVHRRLKNAGLGPLCLELHSNKASKKEVLAELKRTLETGRPGVFEDAALLDGLPAERETLNRYVKAVSEPVGASGLTPFQAIGILEGFATRPEPPPRIEIPALSGWDAAQQREARAVVLELASKIAEIGVPARHPFDGCGLTRILPGEEAAVLVAARALASAAREAAAVAEGPAALDVEIAFQELLQAAPSLEGLEPPGPAWDRAEAVDEAVKLHRALQGAGPDRLLPSAGAADLQSAREDLAAYGGTWFSRFVSSRYRAARRCVLAVCAAPLPKSPEELLAVADAAIERRRLEADLLRAAERAKPLTGSRTDWEGIAAARAWIARLRAFLKQHGLVLRPADPDLRERARSAKRRWEPVVGELAKRLAWTAPWDRFAVALERAEAWIRDISKLPGYVGYWEISRRLSRLGGEPLAAAAHSGTVVPSLLADVFDQAWARQAVDRAFRERPELSGFDAARHEQTIQRFRRADAAVFEANRASVADLHWRSLPGRAGYGQVGLIRRECQKKARHLPLRRLLQEAGAAVQAAKPLFLMSPLSVATYLPPEGVQFDLVVFDEASQVRPVDALGAILRGRQLVVVGDDRQMPPTSFFDAPGSGGEPSEEEESVTEGVQSILGLCTAQGMPSRMLRWHYRSRHESLIAVSNREFYGGNLVVFPSPRRSVEGEGLGLRLLPDTVYERGTTRTNPREAEAVAEAVLQHARTRPGLSLGVVAFSMPQRDAIEKRVEALCRKHADLDAWVNAEREEPFFIKNLENVQGDERDVMLISVGYGRDADGAVSMNFGPLNQAGGERRLNVLITRAKLHCLVFTNLKADDLDLRRAPGPGVAALKAFLAYAAERPVEEGARAAGEGFEEELRKALLGAGLAVDAGVGGGGYRLDLAVLDPKDPGRCLLGIETDGTRYQEARWARDRDRLRDSVLRGLGWRVHRIWSADWFRSRSEALRRCLEAVAQAKGGVLAPGPKAAAGARPRLPEEPPGWAPAALYVPSKPSLRAGADLAELPPAVLGSALLEVVAAEAPVHVDEAVRRLLDRAEQRTGPRRLEAVEGALRVLEGAGRLRRRGSFLWPLKDLQVQPRDRSELPDVSRGAELVCDEECKAALRRAVAEACGCSGEEAGVQALKLLGVKRGEEALARMAALAEDLVREGALVRGPAGGLVLP